MTLVPDYGDPSDPEIRAKYGYLESAVGLVGNSSLFIGKLVIGLLISSVALFGDSLNHLTDIGMSLVIFYGFMLAKKEADREHPFGHARAENVLSVVVASLVIAMGIAVLYASGQGLMEPSVRGSLLVAVVVFVFAIIKEAMARFAFKLADKIDSKALRADGWNHRFDAIISVVIGAGIYLSTISTQLRVIDPIMGIVVGVFVIYTGIRLIKESGDELLGKRPTDETLRAVQEAVSAVNGVRDPHSVLVHDYGSHKSISLHVTVDETISAGEAHEMASQVEAQIKKRVQAEPVVHVETRRDIKRIEMLENEVEKIISGYEEVLSSHNIEVTPKAKGGRIDMHVIVDHESTVDDAHRLVHDIESTVSRRLPNFEVAVHVEPCSGDCEFCQEICSKGHCTED